MLGSRLNIKKPNVFQYEDYKKFLTSILKENRHLRGLQKVLSDAANCQASYLSQVLKKGSKVQLTPDQAFGISNNIFLNSKERDYFLLLVDYQRASSSAYKNSILSKINILKKTSGEIAQILSRPKVESHEDLAVFYSSWIYAYVHIAISIKEYQNVENLSRKMNFSIEKTLQILSKLESMGLAIFESGLWKHSGRQLHLPAESAYICNHHNNWRQQALLDVQEQRNSESIHFSGIYSISKADYQRLQNLITEELKNINKIALNSGTEELIVFCCDFFSL